MQSHTPYSVRAGLKYNVVLLPCQGCCHRPPMGQGLIHMQVCGLSWLLPQFRIFVGLHLGSWRWTLHCALKVDGCAFRGLSVR